MDLRITIRWFLPLLVLLGMACTDEVILESEDVSVQLPDNGIICPGMVNVKLSPELAARLNVATRSMDEAVTGEAGIDEVTARLGKARLVRIFSPAGKYEARQRKVGLDRWYRVECDESTDIESAVEAYRNVSGVEYAGPVYRPERICYAETPVYVKPPLAVGNVPMATGMPFNDPGLPMQWHYDHGDVEVAPEAGIGLFKAWEITTGSPEVVVAVIDVGVNFNHEDLKANMWVNEKERDGKYNTDDDGNGFKDDVYGYNFYLNVGDIQPGDHGTHIAGTIAAVNGNGKGVCGIAGGTGHNDGVRIMSCQIGDPSGVYLSPNLAQAFVYAANNGAVIAQCSWNITGYDEALDEAMEYFNTYAGCDENGNQTGPMKGGVIFVACGNEGREQQRYPATSEKVVAVAALNHNNQRGDYSNYGSWVDIAAPGGAGSKYNTKYWIYSTAADGYVYMSGTSMACPHVSGVAALVLSVKKGPGFCGEQLKKILLESTAGLVDEPLKDKLGAGGLRADLAVWQDDGVAPYKVDDLKVEQDEDLNFLLSWTIAADPNDRQPKTYTVYYGTAPGSGGRWQHEVVVPVETTAGQKMTYRIAEKQTLYFAVAGTDLWGNRSELSNVAEFQWKDDGQAPARVSEATIRLTGGANYLCWKQVSDSGDGLPALYLIHYKRRNGETGSWKMIAPDLQAGEEIRYSLFELAGGIEEYVFTLVAVDKWGNRSVASPEVSAMTVGDRDFVAWPLPLNGDLTLMWGRELTGEKKVTLYDLSGRAVWCRTLVAVTAPGREELTVSGIAAGAYILEVSAGGIKVRKRVLSL